MLTIDALLLELSERVQARAKSLTEKNDNNLAVALACILEELARLEFRMRAIARATLAGCAGTHVRPEHVLTLRAIADGKDLP